MPFFLITRTISLLPTEKQKAQINDSSSIALLKASTHKGAESSQLNRHLRAVFVPFQAQKPKCDPKIHCKKPSCNILISEGGIECCFCISHGFPSSSSWMWRRCSPAMWTWSCSGCKPDAEIVQLHPAGGSGIKTLCKNQYMLYMLSIICPSVTQAFYSPASTLGNRTSVLLLKEMSASRVSSNIFMECLMSVVTGCCKATI